MAVTLVMSIVQNSQNIANNTSNVTVYVNAKWTSGSNNRTGDCTGSITIDGTKYSFSGLTFNDNVTSSGQKTVMTKTVNVEHNADGTKTLECSASFVTGVNSGTVSCSGTKVLSTIPRASTPTVSASSVDMGSAVTITTNRASSSFTHDLAYSFAGGSYVSIATGVGASYSWTTPDLASQIPNATSGTVTIRCITKNGSTTVGTKTVTMTLKVPTSVVPTISSVATEEATSGLAAQFGAFVKSKSKIKATITAAGAKGSTIKSYSTTFNGKTYTGSSWTSGLVTASGSLNLVTTVTDSRGRTAKKTTTITVLNYSAPSISALHVYRVDAEGAAAEDGIYIAVQYKYSVTSLNSKNTASMVVEYKQSTGTEWSSLLTGSALSADTTALPTSPTFSTDYQYDVRLTVTDWFGTSRVYTAQLPSGAVILDIAADGKGLAIGKTSEHGGFESGWRTRLWEDGKTVLWSGASYMTDTQTINLAEPISDQNYGIMLIFSAYRDGAAADYEWTHFFVPKQFVKAHEGKGTSFFMHSVGFTYVGAKYLYISDQKIVGNESNSASGTKNGITFNNAGYVLRYVIGI